MQRTAWTMMALWLVGIAPAWAAGEAGMVEVCRQPGVISFADGKPIALPAGATFADIADARDPHPNGDTYRPVQLRLLQPLTIAAAARCATGRAEISFNPRGFRVGPREYRTYRTSAQFTGPIPELVIHVKDDFR
jgi:hypothetical protein